MKRYIKGRRRSLNAGTSTTTLLFLAIFWSCSPSGDERGIHEVQRMVRDELMRKLAKSEARLKEDSTSRYYIKFGSQLETLMTARGRYLDLRSREAMMAYVDTILAIGNDRDARRFEYLARERDKYFSDSAFSRTDSATFFLEALDRDLYLRDLFQQELGSMDRIYHWLFCHVSNDPFGKKGNVLLFVEVDSSFKVKTLSVEREQHAADVQPEIIRLPGAVLLQFASLTPGAYRVKGEFFSQEDGYVYTTWLQKDFTVSE